MKKQKNIPNVGLAFLCHILIFNQACREGGNHQAKVETKKVPTVEEVDSVARLNIVGAKVTNEDSLYTVMAQYRIIGIGHYHSNHENYAAVQRLIPKLRQSGFLMLAVELPANFQSLLDSIMDEQTPAQQTTELLHRLNKEIKVIDGNAVYSPSQDSHHPLFDLIMAWLNTGGRIAAVDVPIFYNSKTNKNENDLETMSKTIKERSVQLYDKIKDVDINKLDDNKDLRVIAEIRSAYMASMVDYYLSKGVKIVGFLGAAHFQLIGQAKGPVSVSIVQISREYFKTEVFALYPYFTDSGDGFFNGHQWLGNMAYAVRPMKHP